ncbi:hypothetical protein DITRI_Ditri20bG0113400 [Diplodiscus trichospermus]
MLSSLPCPFVSSLNTLLLPANLPTIQTLKSLFTALAVHHPQWKLLLKIFSASRLDIPNAWQMTVSCLK